MMDKAIETMIEQKKIILNHVLYEMQMFLATMELSSDEPLAMNIILESHMLHTRNLLYFFSDEKNDKFKNDIIYKDIVNIDAQAVDDTLLIGETPFNAKYVVNKSFVHLTFSRTEENLAEKTIIMQNAMDKILPYKIKYFINALDEDIKEKYRAELDKEIVHRQLIDIRSRLDNYFYIIKETAII